MEQFTGLMTGLVEKGVHNINFVTPDHFMPHIIEAVKIMKKRGHNIPFVYNCSGYQSISHLETVMDYIDIFLFDYKFADIETSGYCVKLEDYPKIALEGLEFIYKKKGSLKLDEKGLATSGIIVRHLVLPGFVKNSMDVINNLYFNFGSEIYTSLMSQYSPAYLENGFEKLARRVTREEYDAAAELLLGLGFKNGFIQDYIEGEDKYLPDFNGKKMLDNW